MAFNPTPMQKKAIETKGNVLVSAAAGSGKTAVLVERVINMLTDKSSPVSADRLLIVTFTNAAAAEMRSRIEKRLYEEIQKDPDNAILQRQKYLLSSADICTIDSFCIKLVRENFEKCGVEPDFKISDGSEHSAISNSVMRRLIAEYMENPPKDFERLLELTNCEYDEKNLTELVNRIYLYSQQLPFPQRFIEGLCVPYESEFAVGNPWYDMTFEFCERKLSLAKKCVTQMQDVANFVTRNTEKHIDYAKSVFEIFEQLQTAFDKKDWNLLEQFLETVSLKSVPAADKDDFYANTFKANKKIFGDVLKEFADVFCGSAEEIGKSIAQNAGAVKLFVEIVTEYGNRLFKAYAEENSFTFYNMEQLALELLCEYDNDKVVIRKDARSLTDKYDEVLVDEFQDVNDLQNMLFYVLSNREERLFVVGDVKQSIYGFRGSNPDNFLHKKNSYIPIENAGKEDSKKIVLSDNFRSRKGVCDAVNFFFSLMLQGQCGKLIYNDEERLNASGVFPESASPCAELLVVDKFDDDDDETLLETEARHIAEYILSVMQEGCVITEGDTLRQAKFSDFAILLDKVKDKASVIGQVLSEYGIPVTLGGDAFLESYEISTILSLLQVVDNPQCDIELLGTMMSSVFGFTAEEMANIRANKKSGSLYSAVVAYSKTGDKKTTDFIETLLSLRRQATVLPVDSFISKLIHATDILNSMTALSGGKLRRANLFALLKYASAYVAHSNGGIYGFLNYIKALPENSLKSASIGSENTIKIMSMHNSKGLQFPVCIVANLASLINNADSINRVLFSEKCGIAFKYYDEKYALDVQMLGHKIMSDVAHQKTVEEKLRLLYVAATRAIDRLCIVCSAKNVERKLQKIASQLSNTPPNISSEILENSRSMGDWILACALLHPQG